MEEVKNKEESLKGNGETVEETEILTIRLTYL